MKTNKTLREWEASNHRRRKDKQTERSIDLTVTIKSLNSKNN
jgi:hypothetical protein